MGILKKILVTAAISTALIANVAHAENKKIALVVKALVHDAMREASPPRTRFSATADAEGCRNCTLASLPTSKLRHSRIARWLRWVTVSVFAWRARLALPATTRPPSGRAPGSWAAAAGGSRAASAKAAPAIRPCRHAGGVPQR